MTIDDDAAHVDVPIPDTGFPKANEDAVVEVANNDQESQTSNTQDDGCPPREVHEKETTHKVESADPTTATHGITNSHEDASAIDLYKKKQAEGMSGVVFTFVDVEEEIMIDTAEEEERLQDKEKLEKMRGACQTILECMGQVAQRDLMQESELWAKALLFMSELERKLEITTGSAPLEKEAVVEVSNVVHDPEVLHYYNGDYSMTKQKAKQNNCTKEQEGDDNDKKLSATSDHRARVQREMLVNHLFIDNEETNLGDCSSPHPPPRARLRRAVTTAPRTPASSRPGAYYGAPGEDFRRAGAFSRSRYQKTHKRGHHRSDTQSSIGSSEGSHPSAGEATVTTWSGPSMQHANGQYPTNSVAPATANRSIVTANGGRPPPPQQQVKAVMH